MGGRLFNNNRVMMMMMARESKTSKRGRRPSGIGSSRMGDHDEDSLEMMKKKKQSI